LPADPAEVINVPEKWRGIRIAEIENIVYHKEWITKNILII